jgi:hemoglobin
VEIVTSLIKMPLSPLENENRHHTLTASLLSKGNHMDTKSIPTLYEWIGGTEALNRLTKRFYERVKVDPVLEHVFAHMDAGHPAHVAAFIGEVFGGPNEYSKEHGGHPHMIQRHLNLHLTQEQRRQWINLLLSTADELGMTDDPEFRSALVGYLEWGSRLAVINSQDGAVV